VRNDEAQPTYRFFESRWQRCIAEQTKLPKIKVFLVFILDVWQRCQKHRYMEHNQICKKWTNYKHIF